MNDLLPALDLTNVDLLSKDVGEPWINFSQALTPEVADLMQRVYTLLALTDEESVLVSAIANLLSDEDTPVIEIKAILLELLLNNIIEQLVKFGITLDLEQVNANKLDLLYQITDVIYLLNGYEDLEGLSVILEQRDLDPKDRFIELFRKLYSMEPTDQVIDELNYLIDECSEYLMEMLRLSLIVADGVPDIPKHVRERVRANAAFLGGTTAGKHIRNNGQVGMGFLTSLSFYRLELDAAMRQSPEQYIKELFAFAIISETPDDELWDKLKVVIEENVEEVTLLYRAEQLIDEIILPNKETA